MAVAVGHGHLGGEIVTRLESLVDLYRLLNSLGQEDDARMTPAAMQTLMRRRMIVPSSLNPAQMPEAVRALLRARLGQ
jgi:hypothetical protein